MCTKQELRRNISGWRPPATSGQLHAHRMCTLPVGSVTKLPLRGLRTGLARHHAIPTSASGPERARLGSGRGAGCVDGGGGVCAVLLSLPSPLPLLLILCCFRPRKYSLRGEDDAFAPHHIYPFIPIAPPPPAPAPPEDGKPGSAPRISPHHHHQKLANHSIWKSAGATCRAGDAPGLLNMHCSQKEQQLFEIVKNT
eukprot:gene17680-biopygen11396